MRTTNKAEVVYTEQNKTRQNNFKRICGYNTIRLNAHCIVTVFPENIRGDVTAKAVCHSYGTQVAVYLFTGAKAGTILRVPCAFRGCEEPENGHPNSNIHGKIGQMTDSDIRLFEQECMRGAYDNWLDLAYPSVEVVKDYSDHLDDLDAWLSECVNEIEPNEPTADKPKKNGRK